MSVDVSLLYDLCQRLEGSVKKDPDDFELCIEAVNADDLPVKKLAIQIVFRFFDDFLEMQAAALNTLMSQLKHPDVEVGDVLSQLLSIRDNQEVLLVKKSLSIILTRYPKATILAMYTAVTKAESIEEKVAVLKFMDEKVTRLNAKSRQIGEQEKQTTYSAAMKRLVEKGVSLDRESDVDDPSDFSIIVNNVVKIVLILNSAERSYVMSRVMTDYLFSKFDKLSHIHSSDRKDIMKVLSTITYLGTYEGPEDSSSVIHLFNYLKGLLPDPCPDDTNMEDSYVAKRNEKEWDIEFSEVELVSIVVYNILQRKRFIAKELQAVSEEWKPRFQYLVNVIRVFTLRLKKKLDEDAKNNDEVDTRSSRLLAVANNVGCVR
ncbi:unnamed protein product [Heligmosomoides polygyrus]|uniref:Apoptosis inhibitory protein 5 n=1 Tax=Heligmosomoides polygyrus TaxID=6339 RepID=A0A183FLL0_HELPZ|nr:unnamed protein product [Heligmosomoides polygyrus]